MSINKVTPERLARLRVLKNQYRDLDRKAKEAKRVHDEEQAAIFEDMREEQLLTIKTDDATFSRKATIYAHVQDMEEFAAWCRERELEEEFLREKEESARLNELVRGLIDNGEELPPGVGWYSREYISITEN